MANDRRQSGEEQARPGGVPASGQQHGSSSGDGGTAGSPGAAYDGELEKSDRPGDTVPPPD